MNALVLPCQESDLDNHKTTVLHVLNMNPDKHGVLELQLLEMARQLTEIGWQQIVVFSNELQPWMKEWSDRTGGIMLSVPDPAVAGAARVAEIAQEYHVDLVHIHLITQNTLYKALRQAGCKIFVTTIHSFRKPQKLESIRRILKHFNTLFIKHFIAVSEYINRQACRDYLLSDRRITTVLNGINTEYYRPREDKYELRQSLFGLGADIPLISIISHLAPGKRLHMLIEAMPIVLKQVPDAQLVIAGGGIEHDRLQALVIELNMQSHIRIMHSANKTELIYAASDFAVLPSEGEGLAGSAIEALACGLPLIYTPNGGLVEVAEDGVSGISVTNQTPEGLAEAIVTLCKDQQKRAQMGKAARARVERLFDVRETARKTIQVYKDVLGIN